MAKLDLMQMMPSSASDSRYRAPHCSARGPLKSVHIRPREPGIVVRLRRARSWNRAGVG